MDDNLIFLVFEYMPIHMCILVYLGLYVWPGITLDAIFEEPSTLINYKKVSSSFLNHSRIGAMLIMDFSYENKCVCRENIRTMSQN